MQESGISFLKRLTLAAIGAQTLLFLSGVLILIFAEVKAHPFPAIFEYILIAFSIEITILLLWAILDYFLLYKALSRGKLDEAEKISLTLGIFQLLIGGVIAGVILIVTHNRIKHYIKVHSTI